MTNLEKPVTRRTVRAYGVLLPHKPERIIVTLAPGDVIEFRAEKKRGRWSVPIAHVFRQAVRAKALNSS